MRQSLPPALLHAVAHNYQGIFLLVARPKLVVGVVLAMLDLLGNEKVLAFLQEGSLTALLLAFRKIGDVH